jgi:hypothetical protein
MDQIKPIFIEKFLPDSLITVVNQYAITKTLCRDTYFDNTVNAMAYSYGDPLMETILDLSTSVVEKHVGKSLWPTFSFMRVYDKGSDLEIHTDRPSCEYTVALALGEFPVNKPYPLYIGELDPTSEYKYFNIDKKLEPVKINYKYDMIRNNAVLFQGQTDQTVHWREFCTHDHFITCFFHYVNKEGPHAQEKWDKRSMLGMPSVKDDQGK